MTLSIKHLQNEKQELSTILSKLSQIDAPGYTQSENYQLAMEVDTFFQKATGEQWFLNFSSQHKSSLESFNISTLCLALGEAHSEGFAALKTAVLNRLQEIDRLTVTPDLLIFDIIQF